MKALTSWNSNNCLLLYNNCISKYSLILKFCLSVTPVTPVAAPQVPACQSVTSMSSVNPVMNIRHASPSTAPTVSVAPQPSSNVMTQRVLLSPDMQARLPCKYTGL